MCRESAASGDHIPDAYLAAIAIEHGAEWITADRGFARYPGLRRRHPLD
ncbi:PIN domain-containing protein [Saccharopolyspora sp. MS10]